MNSFTNVVVKVRMFPVIYLLIISLFVQVLQKLLVTFHGIKLQRGISDPVFFTYIQSWKKHRQLFRIPLLCRIVHAKMCLKKPMVPAFHKKIVWDKTGL